MDDPTELEGKTRKVTITLTGIIEGDFTPGVTETDIIHTFMQSIKEELSGIEYDIKEIDIY